MNKLKKRKEKSNKQNKHILCPYCGSSNRRHVRNRNNKVQYKCNDCSKHFTVDPKSQNSVRVIVISDTHCGHEYGLTPPAWHRKLADRALAESIDNWNWFKQMVDRMRPYNVLIYNGDAIDGRGEKSESSELIGMICMC